MTADVHTLTGAYAMDALPEDERRMFERHLEQCPACAQEVRELSATAARLGGAAAAAGPPPAMRQRVLARVGSTRQLPPLAVEPDRALPAATGPAGRTRPWFRAPLGIAASLLLALSLALGGLAVDRQRRLAEAEEQARAIAAVTADPDRVERSAEVTAGGTATIVAAGGAAVLAARDLPRLPEDRAYQLWVLGPQGVRSAGLLLVRDGVAQALVPGVASGESLAVSVEPAAGSEQPTTDPIVVLPVA